ncbi:hypothetical protein DPSP01_000881 [Paraphaeosphaeria sporulosa]|uniref:Rhodopsin domain-containing protein n=1 Tax=Paraphaeosphaeria sporulosa TaxID=1460663 RepID=A0A177CQ92_9PLEO|nr:uncharacterized protein CC84DRAFT_1160557 [Paraphaeosphaeria sporulosa]OAG09391.1 hypothetical protein CC84DRAFT_1160557 [Paraphaeosphaeria sporulosa]
MDLSLIPSPPTETAKAWARAHAGVTITLNIVAFLMFCGRVYTRSYPVMRLNADDYAIAIAWLLILAESVFLLLTVPFVFGRDPSTITLQDLENAVKYATIAQPLWAWGMAAIKTSIALMLLRFETNRNLRRFLWGNIAVQVVLAFYNMLSQLLQCSPLDKLWDLTGTAPGRCWSAEAAKINLICQSVIVVATDIILALMPISFLRKVQRPLRERIIIGSLMGLGMLASIASIAKIEASLRLEQVGDATSVGIQVGMWSAVEELIAFICACVPCLRSPFQRLLKYVGVMSTQKPSTGRGYYNMGAQARSTKTTKGSGSRTLADNIKTKRSIARDTDSDEIVLSKDNGRNRGIWRTTEVHVEDEIGLPLSIYKGPPDAQESCEDHSPTSGTHAKGNYSV